MSLNLERLERRVVLAGDPTWQTITPEPIPIESSYDRFNTVNSGRVDGVSIDPTDNNTIFIATAGGGVWKTIDGGNTWTPQTDNVPVVEFMGAIAEADSGGNEIVYAGTGDANICATCYYGEGILVSTNGGDSWTLQNNGGKFTGLTTSKIVIDPFDLSGKTAYAAMADYGNAGNGSPIANLSALANTGIWKTTDNGATWTNMTANTYPYDMTDSWSDVVIDPLTKNTLYAVLGTSTGAAKNGVYKSTDGGMNWSLLANGPTYAKDNTVGRITLALYDKMNPDGTTTNELFVSVSTTTGGVQMWKSLDGGTTFTDLTNNVNNMVGNYLGTEGQYDTTLAISPLDPSFIYASGDQQYDKNHKLVIPGNIESFDGGNTWQAISEAGTAIPPSEPHTDAHAVAFDKSGDVLEGDDGGLFLLEQPHQSAAVREPDLGEPQRQLD